VSSDSRRKRKLFFALWPDESTRRTLRRATRDITAGGMRMPAANLHITLAFVGFVDAATQRCMEEAASKLQIAPFDIVLDRVGSFGQKILWIGSSQPPEALFTLQQALETALVDNCGYRAEDRPYRPHVTIERKLKAPLEAPLQSPVIWRADRLALVESVASPEPRTPPHYQPLRDWRFTASDLTE